MGRRWLIISAVGALAAIWCIVSMMQSAKPTMPDLPDRPDAPAGYVTVEMTARLMDAQLDGFGGWIPNDIPLSPSYYLDNLPNFQLGVLNVIRHMTRVLRDNLTRQRTSDQVHTETDSAYSAFANDPAIWVLPAAEGKYRAGAASLRRFAGELGGDAKFYPRADNLVQLLEALVSELGAATTLLLNSHSEKVAWRHVDDNFYRAQGTGFALLGVMRAVREDFSRVLNDKNAEEIMELILESLAESQFEPLLVTNGDKDSLLANHSSNLKAYLDDARQKMNSLITIVKQG